MEVILLSAFLLITMTCTTKTRRFILKGPTLLLLRNLVVYLFIHPGGKSGEAYPRHEE
jgi:hypothetical protein